MLKLHLPEADGEWQLPENAEMYAPGKVMIPMKKDEVIVLESR